MGKIKYLIFSLALFISLSNNVNAASATLSASNNDVIVGNDVKISSTISSDKPIFFIEGTFTCSGAGINKTVDLKFETMENNKKSNYYSMTVKPSKIEKIQCKVNGKVIDADSSNWVNVSKSITINVVKPREKSNNNNLKSLGVDGYNLTPNFNKDTLEYSVEIPADATKINIYASKEDGYASVSGTGEKDVIEGDNRFEIIVTSETGKSKTYIVNANVKDNNPIIVKVDNKELTVVKRIDSLTKPSEEYVDKKVTISEIEIPAFYNEKNNLTLIGLKDDKGIISLYKYDEENKKYSKYEELISKSITIISEKVVDIPKNYKETTIKIDDKTYTVYKDTKNQNISLIYGLNLETGKKNWYQYDEVEKTLQVNDNSEIESLIKDYESKIDTYKLLIIGLGSLTILLLIIILILIVKKSKKKKK